MSAQHRFIAGIAGSICGVVLTVFVAGKLSEVFGVVLLWYVACGAVLGAGVGVFFGRIRIGQRVLRQVAIGIVVGAIIGAVASTVYARVRSNGRITKSSAPYQRYGLYVIMPTATIIGGIAGCLIGVGMHWLKSGTAVRRDGPDRGSAG